MTDNKHNQEYINSLSPVEKERYYKIAIKVAKRKKKQARIEAECKACIHMTNVYKIRLGETVREIAAIRNLCPPEELKKLDL